MPDSPTTKGVAFGRKFNVGQLYSRRDGDLSTYPDDTSMVTIEAVWERFLEMVPKVHLCELLAAIDSQSPVGEVSVGGNARR